ncbi:MAG TPA: LysM peptidoglycan-binding domain-containing protein [Gaiellaceae bacterium]|nr:LysM peptidoglycan-binding domain-containing protein [Gaiellaceae bacterium]
MSRVQVVRYVAPAVFLLAVTIAVLLVRSSLRSPDDAVTRTAPARVPAKSAADPATPKPQPVLKRFYVIRSGDTLESIAGRLNTTVARLLELNPGIEPTTLRPGQEVRIK